MVIPAVVVFRPRARSWLLWGFVSLVIALCALYWFFDPAPMWVRFLGGAVIVAWVYYLGCLTRARLELRESTVEVYGPPALTLSARTRAWVYYVLIPLVICDFLALLFGSLSLWARRVELGARIALAAIYVVGLAQVFESGRCSLKYLEITAAPWEERLTPVATILQMGIASSTRPFSFPPWLSAGDRREVAGRVAARMKRAHALEPREAHSEPAATAAEGSGGMTGP